ncbi:hypothetical protein ACO0LF_06385 [Undibacterium sp. Di27W]|uniref:hypothetical protein n=1 Tax=Undibacterium sp. Di27W TaxID=3413036 RepID=UPI003BEFA271
MSFVSLKIQKISCLKNYRGFSAAADAGTWREIVEIFQWNNAIKTKYFIAGIDFSVFNFQKNTNNHSCN